MNTHDKYELPPPHGYIYVWDGPRGTHRLTAGQYNGRQCDRAVAYYTEDQVRAAIEANRKHTDDLIARYQEKIRSLEAENHALISESGDRQSRGEYVLAKHQPCGCVICTCEDNGQCQGCGARHCGTHPIAKFSNPVYETPSERARGEPVAVVDSDGNETWAELVPGHDLVPGQELYAVPHPAEPIRGEPVACFKCGHSKHGGECVNVAPQPAESEKTDGTCQECGGDGAGGEHEDDSSHGEPVAWRVHPFDYGIGVEGAYAITQLETMRDSWEIKGWNIEPLYLAPQPQQIPEDFVDELAQEIRRVDGNHSLGAAALAERLVPFFSRTLFEVAPQPQQIPEGYALVPIEPTPEMLKSGWAENDVPLALRWKAMIKAAPEVKP